VPPGCWCLLNLRPLRHHNASCCAQAGCGAGSVSMLYLQPRAVYPDPFRAGNHVLVLCDVMTPPPVQVRCVSLLLHRGLCSCSHLLITARAQQRAVMQKSTVGGGLRARRCM
jgi:hypothetical protein